ncbi:MAG: hypothetical protein ACOY0T_06780 [Myxococcota bacterium]
MKRRLRPKWSLWCCAASAGLFLFSASTRASNPTSAGSASALALAWPQENTPEPHAPDWDSLAAVPVAMTRVVGARASACIASRFHEWLRVRCPALRVSAINQVGGDTAGTRFAIDAPGSDGVSQGGEVVLPLRPRERRIVMFWSLGPGYDGPLTVVPGLVLQSDWSGSTPFIGLYDAVHEPVRTASSERRRVAQPGTTGAELTW